jgi:hypothetical protein
LYRAKGNSLWSSGDLYHHQRGDHEDVPHHLQDGRTAEDSHQADIDAPSKEKAIKTLRANTRVTDIVKVEDVTGPSELKELLRF